LDGEAVVALIAAGDPLVIVRESEPDGLEERTLQPVVLHIPSLNDSLLRCEVAPLVAVFPLLVGLLGTGPDCLNPQCFTAQDLWVATV
jgi:hypothetical protein